MTDLGEAFYVRAMASDAVRTSLVGGLHPVMVPQGTVKPYARYQVVSDPRPQTLKARQAFRQSRIQVDVFDDDYLRGRQISMDIIAEMTGGAVIGEVVFGQTVATGPRDLGEDTAEGFIYRASTDLLVWHKAQ